MPPAAVLAAATLNPADGPDPAARRVQRAKQKEGGRGAERHDGGRGK